MKDKVWQPNSVLYKAAIEGIKKADPSAKFAIQAVALAATHNNLFLKDFFKSFFEFGVQLDYFGLTYLHHTGDSGADKFIEATTPYFEHAEYIETLKFLFALGKSVISGEFVVLTLYSSTAGMFKLPIVSP